MFDPVTLSTRMTNCCGSVHREGYHKWKESCLNQSSACVTEGKVIKAKMNTSNIKLRRFVYTRIHLKTCHPESNAQANRNNR